MALSSHPVKSTKPNSIYWLLPIFTPNWQFSCWGSWLIPSSHPILISLSKGHWVTPLIFSSKHEYIFFNQFSSVQSISHVWLYDPSTPGLQHIRSPCPSPTLGACSNSCPKASDAIQPSHPLLSPPHPAFNLSQHHGLNKWVSSLHQWPKYWTFSFSISPSNEYSGLLSFRMDWLDLLAVQGTLKSLLQHQSSKASVLWCSAFFMVQLSHLYMTTGKTIALTRWTFLRKVMSLLFNMLSRFVIAFLPRSKHLLISWLPSPSAVILEPKKIKSDTVCLFAMKWWDGKPWC